MIEPPSPPASPAEERETRKGTWIAAATIFVASALVFTMEPLVGRMLVPELGSAAYVWLTCLNFYQAALLVGYVYAERFADRIGIGHIAAVALAAAWLPLSISVDPSAAHPILAIVFALVRRIGVPFALLSSTSVVVQSWLARSSRIRVANPYPLYAASNLGSMLALAAYPLLIETTTGVRVQRIVWAVGYVALLALLAASWRVLRPVREEKSTATSQKEPEANVEESAADSVRTTPVGSWPLWIALSALTSGLLVATTNVLAMEVGSIPLVWTLPLIAFLGSFVFAFREEGLMRRATRKRTPECVATAILLGALGASNAWVVLGYVLTLGLLSIVLHGALYDSRPSASKLGSFYTALAIGGWLGGSIVTFGAPVAFSSTVEFPVLALVAGLLLAWRKRGELKQWLDSTSFLPRTIRIAVVMLAMTLGLGAQLGRSRAIFAFRNLYGTYRVQKDDNVRGAKAGVLQLVHGSTLHGAQLVDPSEKLVPITYYHRGGPHEEVVEVLTKPRRIAIIGLGAGLLTAYGLPGDRFDYYELDPDGEWIARKFFTFMDESKADVRVFVGDGRIRLAESSERYDLVLVDAFSGDGVPSHLLTLEAIRVYLEHAENNGLVMFHVPNRYFALAPVVRAAAKELGVPWLARKELVDPQAPGWSKRTECIALVRDPAQADALRAHGWKADGGTAPEAIVTPWTDDYVNPLGAAWLKFRSTDP